MTFDWIHYKIAPAKKYMNQLIKWSKQFIHFFCVINLNNIWESNARCLKWTITNHFIMSSTLCISAVEINTKKDRRWKRFTIASIVQWRWKDIEKDLSSSMDRNAPFQVVVHLMLLLLQQTNIGTKQLYSQWIHVSRNAHVSFERTIATRWNRIKPGIEINERSEWTTLNAWNH